MKAPTLAFTYIGRNAGQVAEFDWRWKLSEELYPFIISEYAGPWYSLIQEEDGAWWLVAHVGCAWDFATGWLDWDWLKEGSLGHDILHWLIKRGHIHHGSAANRAIDSELMLICRERGSAFGLKTRSWVIKTATNLLDQKTDGAGREVVYLYGRGK